MDEYIDGQLSTLTIDLSGVGGPIGKKDIYKVGLNEDLCVT